jgi:hypothetical protein
MMSRRCVGVGEASVVFNLAMLGEIVQIEGQGEYVTTEDDAGD